MGCAPERNQADDGRLTCVYGEVVSSVFVGIAQFGADALYRTHLYSNTCTISTNGLELLRFFVRWLTWNDIQTESNWCGVYNLA
jgi:hypothetical protein